MSAQKKERLDVAVKPTYDKETIEALKGSIEKWRKVKDECLYDRGSSNCDLCKSFVGCDGCPVSQATGRVGCHCTPYDEWDVHQRRDHGEVDPFYYVHPGCKECERLAQTEYDFLKGLLSEAVGVKE